MLHALNVTNKIKIENNLKPTVSQQNALTPSESPRTYSAYKMLLMSV
jgi:hypothetical protein